MGEWKQRILVGMIVVLLMIISVLTTLLVTGRSNRSAEVQEPEPVYTVTEDVVADTEDLDDTVDSDLVAVTIEHEDGTSEVVFTDEEIFKVAATIGEVPTDLMTGELAEIANDGGVGTVLADLILKCVEYFNMQPDVIWVEFTGGTLVPESNDYSVILGDVQLYITLWINPYNFQVSDANGHVLLTGPEFKYGTNNLVESYAEEPELYTAGYTYVCKSPVSYSESDVIDEFKEALPTNLIERIETFPEEDQSKLFSAFITLVDYNNDKASTIRLIGINTPYVHYWSYFEPGISFNYDDTDMVMFINSDTGNVEVIEY